MTEQQLISEQFIGPMYAPQLLQRTVELVDVDMVAESVSAEVPVRTVSTVTGGPGYAPIRMTTIDYSEPLEK